MSGMDFLVKSMGIDPNKITELMTHINETSTHLRNNSQTLIEQNQIIIAQNGEILTLLKKEKTNG